MYFVDVPIFLNNPITLTIYSVDVFKVTCSIKAASLISLYSPPGLFTVVIFCLLTALPHYLYGPGENALTLTTEYGAQFNHIRAMEILETQKKKTLCQPIG